MTAATKKIVRTALSESELAQLDRVRERQRLTRTEAVRAAIQWYLGSVGSLPPAEDATDDEIVAIRRGEEEFARGETRRLEDVQRDLGLPGMSCLCGDLIKRHSGAGLGHGASCLR